MREKIKPTTKFKEEEEEVVFELEDKDYLLITAINNLADEIKATRLQSGR